MASASASSSALTTEQLQGLIERYHAAIPRYTSYPTAVEFDEAFDDSNYRKALSQASTGAASLYVHIPFCQKRCTFCACSVICSPEHDRVAPSYVDAVLNEMQMVCDELPACTGGKRKFAQLHLGGGTPTYLSPALLEKLYSGICDHFEPLENAEISIELDPRVTTNEQLELLINKLGVNRVSFGVQDLDPQVQEYIGREQCAQRSVELIKLASKLGINSVNVDLIYGLPGQDEDSLLKSIDILVEAGSDRFALFGYAHVPWLHPHQKSLPQEHMPSTETRIRSFCKAREHLLKLGFSAIGLDHFARPADPLSVANESGTLLRNFMGYGVQQGDDILAFGCSSIGDVAGSLVQNTTKLNRYYEALEHGRLPVHRGLARTDDDLFHGKIIFDLMCQHRVDLAEVSSSRNIDAGIYFAEALDTIDQFERDGLLLREGTSIELTQLGRLFVRNVAYLFDQRSHLRKQSSPTQRRFSQSV